MPDIQPYTEEAFGILTDDDLYLDCLFVRPANTDDAHLRAIRVWVPKYPLTKTSVLTCARQEVKSYGPDGKVGHLVFDLRGTGDSDGLPGDQSFNHDLMAIKSWSEERFGPRINFGFFGFPYSANSRVYMWPLRPGIVMETYYYHPAGANLSPHTVLYLSSYGNFNREDDALCTALAQAGYAVYGLDPFRYLLHASLGGLLTPEVMAEDLQLLIQMLPEHPVLIAGPLAAGLGILWASMHTAVKGLIAIGRAQAGLAPAHIFQNRNPHTFFLPRYIRTIAPRPVALVRQQKHPLGGIAENMQALFASSQEPHRLEEVGTLSAETLLSLIHWVEETAVQPAQAG